MKIIKGSLFYLLIICLPLLLIITSIRLVLSPLYLEVEYRLPGFPDDPYGFTFTERMHYAKLSAEYLVNPAGIDFLGNIKMKDGFPLYNARELSHMRDVKILTGNVLQFWYALIALYTISFLLFLTSKDTKKIWLAMMRGGWLTIALIATVILGVIIDFDALFTAFHRIFFTGDTWLFFLNDSMIRLFPEKLWMDVFFFIGGFSMLFAVLAIFLGRRFSRK
jgi:integral membrane protein (TIGR01906 family)